MFNYRVRELEYYCSTKILTILMAVSHETTHTPSQTELFKRSTQVTSMRIPNLNWCSKGIPSLMKLQSQLMQTTSSSISWTSKIYKPKILINNMVRKIISLFPYKNILIFRISKMCIVQKNLFSQMFVVCSSK